MKRNNDKNQINLDTFRSLYLTEHPLFSNVNQRNYKRPELRKSFATFDGQLIIYSTRF